MFSTSPFGTGRSFRLGAASTPEERLEKWKKNILPDWQIYKKKYPGKLKDKVRRGVPDEIRGTAWPEMLMVSTLRGENGKAYQTFLAEEDVPCDSKIKKDLHRTFPQSDYFKEANGPGQRALYNVLKAYSLFDPQLGYSQGLSYMTGLLLLYLRNEEVAFWCLVRIMKDPKFSYEGFHMANSDSLGKYLHQLEVLLDEYLPKLSAHLKAQGVALSFFASEWVITAYSRSFPTEVCARIWDAFLYEGHKVIFRVSVALLKLAQDDLLKCNFEGAMELFKSIGTRAGENPDLLMSTAFELRNLSLDHLKKLAVSYVGDDSDNDTDN
mmetsp:Transcript_38019/g.61600  ORF Transcript_38019/g.61600 Transcript_38019/m.61600 type:complete len:324 (+) Transcript_38019:177-1148(+)|eukprot:CAMPEP_0184662136 /NCGR_PEP_ID=MMETSP0308-20130426/41777_1 /TAXON_ID=38269 /ORGANISM="Gloeochaete witrockiana, Strain SAG 46.84" /LENGTH=323 /DNA_ID=CAMNT_0027103923 /DNA_START=123 /DNA_END=1094 /DNA_ORIENTATION=+